MFCPIRGGLIIFWILASASQSGLGSFSPYSFKIHSFWLYANDGTLTNGPLYDFVQVTTETGEYNSSINTWTGNADTRYFSGDKTSEYTYGETNIAGLAFDGSDDYVTVADDASFDVALDESLSVSVWMKADDDNPSASQYVVTRGDTNGDWAVDLLDVITAVNHILETSTLEGDDLWAADCNDDGGINLLDLIGIVNVILGIGECAP